MAKRLQHRGGTTSQHSTFTGAVREVTVDTDKNTLVVHDGATAGGHPLATATNFTSTGIDDNATSTAITIDSSQRVGLGTTSPQKTFVVSNSGAEGYEISPTDVSGVIRQIAYNRSTTSHIALRTNASQHEFLVSDSEKMRIDSSGNVLVGTTTQVGETATSGLFNPTLSIKGARDGLIELISSRSDSANAGVGRLQSVFSNNSASHKIVAEIQTETEGSTSNQRGGRIKFNTKADGSTGVTERMRIDSSGIVMIGTTNTNPFATNTAGISFGLGTGLGVFTRDGGDVLAINRKTSDGVLVNIGQDGNSEGSITVSGATVSYNGFTGSHWSRFTDNSTPIILKGTVLESLDEMCDWYNLEFDVTTTTQDKDGNDVTNTVTEKVPHILADGQSDGDVITYNHEGIDVQATIVKEKDIKHVKSKVSDTVDAKNVYGVFVAYDLDGEGYNDFYVASVGSFVVRIKANETIAKGDLLQSNGDGTAKVQTDDNVKSSSFAKVLSTTIIETYEDGSYLVPCSLMC